MQVRGVRGCTYDMTAGHSTNQLLKSNQVLIIHSNHGSRHGYRGNHENLLKSEHAQGNWLKNKRCTNSAK